MTARADQFDGDAGAVCHSLKDAFERDGYVIVPDVLSADVLSRVRAALDPYLRAGPKGRNEFEGRETNRVYALLAKDDVFAELATHPLALAFVERDLGPSCLLSAFLAINLQPGETAQPWHHDDAHISLPRPRRRCGVSVFWAIDPMTEENGATELLPGSHLWGEENPNGALSDEDFSPQARRDGDPGARPDAVKAVMPAGAMMALKGDLWHRGGANLSASSRLILTPQYCAGWARPLENMLLATPPARAAQLSERARELVGYSIHPPFMGYVDGVHPRKTLPR
ncbi:MAG: phytanoyl-CoA dioxygenase family protein [Alphaproteobacteria bacterium]|nr:phytanoyl-CoA dioxygenase family protein [Alphaproteobacteria bacterium]